MPPLLFFLLLVTVTALALLATMLERRRGQAGIRALAATHGLNFSPADRFRLADRVADAFPIPGAAGVRVTNLLWREAGRESLYIFTVHYTLGVVRTKRRMQRTARCVEKGGQLSPPELGDANLPLREQYASFVQQA